MTHVLHRSLSLSDADRRPAEKASMSTTPADRKYLDGCSGAAVSCLGHSDGRVKRAIAEQLRNGFPSPIPAISPTKPVERLAEKLAERAPGALDWAFFISGGSEAIEAALKMARQYFVERGETGRAKFIARRQSFHGNTLGALAAGGNHWRRAQFEPLLIETHRIEPCYEYRGRGLEETPERYGLQDGRRAGEQDPRTRAGHRGRLHRRDRDGRDRGRRPPHGGVLSGESARSATATASC